MYRPEFRKYRRIFWWCVGVFFLMTGAFGFYLFGNIPSVGELENTDTNQATIIYSADGQVLGSFFRGENREYIKLNRIPRHLQDALIVTEDVRFYEHSGIDFFGVVNMFLSAFTYVYTGDLRGGSTITQQLARNLYDDQVGTERTLIRKIKEAAAAVYLERKFTKRELINHYLNTVPFGGTIYGVQAAARYYFDKDAIDLLPHESALLIGILKGPTQYNPYRNVKRCLERRNIVINQLLKYNKITAVRATQLRKMPLSVVAGVRKLEHNAGLATYFREHLRGWIQKQIDEKNIKIIKNGRRVTPNLYTDGLKIYTTIDTRVQRHAEEAVRMHMGGHQARLDRYLKGREPWKRDTTILTRAMGMSARYNTSLSAGLSKAEAKATFFQKRPMRLFRWEAPGYIDTVITPWDSLKYYAGFLETGLVSIEPSTGHIKAWVGGVDNQFFHYDHVALGKRQVGSTFKPFVYTVAFDNGRSPCEVFDNQPITITTDLGVEWTPKNVDSHYGGSMNLRKALMLSVNVIAARLINQVGPHEVVKYAHNMGIESRLDPYPSIALGTFDLSVLELTSAYGTMANMGVWNEPTFVTHVEDKNGNLLYRFVSDSREAIPHETAYLMADVLRGVVTGGTAANLHYEYKVPTEVFVAGKTGTTQNHSDGWFCGFTPYLATGVWVGCSDRNVGFTWSIDGQGGRMAMPIFANMTRLLYEDKELNYDKLRRFPPPRSMKVILNCEEYNARYGKTAETEKIDFYKQ